MQEMSGMIRLICFFEASYESENNLRLNDGSPNRIVTVWIYDIEIIGQTIGDIHISIQIIGERFIILSQILIKYYYFTASN